MSTWRKDTRYKRYIKPLQTILAVVILLALALPPIRVSADVGPIPEPGGAAILPGEGSTQVRMMAETVTLDVARTPERLSEAWVTADFTLRNLGGIPEPLIVGFPLSCEGCVHWVVSPGTEEPELTTEHTIIDDLSVYVNTLQVATHQATLDTPNFSPASSDEIMGPHYPSNWAVFDVTFPPGQDVFIRVTYTADDTSYYPNSEFTYILITGSAWNGAIGSIDIIARLPYPVNDQNFLGGGYGESDNSDVIVSGNELRWHFDDLEPTANFHLSIVNPWLWQSVLIEEENVRLNPQDGEAWGRLGLAYKEVITGYHGRGQRTDPAGVSMYTRAIEAYQHATTLLPQDAMWHAGFAELLFNHFYWNDYIYNRRSLTEIPSELTRAVDEIRLSLELDPTNEKALYLFEWISSDFPGVVQLTNGQSDYPILTSTAGFAYLFGEPTRPPSTPVARVFTPTPRSTIAPTETVSSVTQSNIPPSVVPTQVAVPASSTPSALASPASISRLWVAVPVGVLILLGLGWLLRRNST